MAISRLSSMKNAYRFFYIAVDAVNQRLISGRMYHESRKEGTGFGSLLDMVWIVNQVFDRINCPLESMQPRNFESLQAQVAREVLEPEPEGGDWEVRRSGKLATFSLFVKYRYHASWQGCIRWIEEGRTIEFGSFLELVRILHSILPGEAEDLEAPENLHGQLRLSVDAYDSGRMVGTLSQIGWHSPWRFVSVMDLMLRMDRLFELLQDAGGQDGGTVVLNRTLGIFEARGRMATFMVRIRFHEHYTWQGSVYWKERGERVNFRSFLELIMLMDAALMGLNCWRKQEPNLTQLG